MLIATVSAKGSPGASTVALGLAARWPEPEAVLVETDPAGGDLVTRFGLYHKPGLSTMALAGRDGQAQPQPQEWTQRLPCRVPAVLAAPGPAAAASLATMGGRAPRMLRLLADRHPAVVVDAGRWQPSSAVDPILVASDVVVLVVRPVPEEIRQADVRLQGLRELTGDLRLVLVGEGGAWPPREVADALGVPVAQVVPVDRRGAGVLAGRLAPRRGWASAGWTRLPLLCACHSLARQLARSAGASDRPEPAPAAPTLAARHSGNGQVVTP